MAAGKSGRWERWAILFSILLGFALRLFLLNRFPLREDEAIYGYWSLHFLHEDPWFLHVWPDKPPIFIWLLSGAFSLFGASPAGGRILNILISTLTIPLVGITAQRLWGARSGRIAGWAMALSPFAISFAPTLFTDPLLVLAGSLAFYCALTHRPFWAGIWLATAIMTKQQGVLYVPLVFFGGWGGGEVGRWGERGKGRKGEGDVAPHHLVTLSPVTLSPVTLSHFLIGLLLIILPILVWDSQRWSVAPSPWDWSMRNYAPLRFVLPGEWANRARQWGDLLWYLAANWWVWGLLALMLLVKGVRWQRVCAMESAPTSSCHRPMPYIGVLFWSLAFIALHITTTLQIWDRYLLPLASIIALSIAWLNKEEHPSLHPPHPFGKLRASSAFRTHSASSGQVPPSAFRIPLSALLILLLLPAWAAANGHLPIGGDHGDYNGFGSALSSLHSEVNSSKPNPTHYAPRTTQFILYHRALGWHYQFYLYDAVRSGEVELRWYPDSVYLADNASKAPHLHKFLIEPSWSPTRDLEFHLRSGGLQFKKLAQDGNFTLFEIVQPPQPFCSWCFSSVRHLFPTLTDFAAPAMICKP